MSEKTDVERIGDIVDDFAQSGRVGDEEAAAAWERIKLRLAVRVEREPIDWEIELKPAYEKTESIPFAGVDREPKPD